MVGVSADDVESHKRFADSRRLPFTLIADEGGRIAEQYGVKKTLGLLPGRVTFVIDRGGVVRYTFNSQLFIDRHITKALESVRGLS